MPIAKWLMAVLVLGAATAPALAADEESLAVGAVEYAAACSSCHGAAGAGDGPVARFLTPQPSDLTTIARAAGGTYPADGVYAIIEGTSLVGAHGTRAMPVWGRRFLLEFEAFPGEQNDEALTRERIQRLVDFIATLQVL